MVLTSVHSVCLGWLRHSSAAEAASGGRCAGAEQAAAEAQLPQWQTSGDSLDMTLLTARDPIQFYAEVPLYESELDDNGTSQLSVKVLSSSHIAHPGRWSSEHVLSACLYRGMCPFWFRSSADLAVVSQVRVMPGCWYALLRFFLRVDGTLVRMREARLFCDLKEPNKVCTSPFVQVTSLHRTQLHIGVDLTPPPRSKSTWVLLNLIKLSCTCAGCSNRASSAFSALEVQVVREVKHSESTLAQLSGNAPADRGVSDPIIACCHSIEIKGMHVASELRCSGMSKWVMQIFTCLQVAHRDADSAALALSAIAPDGVKEYRIDTLCL